MKKTILIINILGIIICLTLFALSVICNISTYSNLLNMDGINLKAFVVLRILVYIYALILLVLNIIILAIRKKPISKKIIIFSALSVFIIASLITVVVVEKNYNSYDCTNVFSQLKKSDKIFSLISYGSYNDRNCEVSKLFDIKSVRLQQSDEESEYIIDYVQSDSKAVTQQYIYHYKKRFNNLKEFNKMIYNKYTVYYKVQEDASVYGIDTNTTSYYCFFVKDNLVCAVEYMVDNKKSSISPTDEVIAASYDLLGKVG